MRQDIGSRNVRRHALHIMVSESSEIVFNPCVPLGEVAKPGGTGVGASRSVFAANKVLKI